MSDVNNPDGVVTYTLAQPMAGMPNRIYEYDKKQEEGVTLVVNPPGSTVVQLVKGGSSDDDVILITPPSPAAPPPPAPIFVGIQIQTCDNPPKLLYPYAILIRQKSSGVSGNQNTVFPAVTITESGTRLVLQDNVPAQGTGGTGTSYDFDILFSTEPQSTGDMGWLDPKLENNS